MRLKKLLVIPFAFVGLVGLASCNGTQNQNTTVPATTNPTTTAPTTVNPTTAPTTTPTESTTQTVVDNRSREVKFLSKYLSDAAKQAPVTDKYGYELDFNLGLSCELQNGRYTFGLTSTDNLYLNLNNATSTDNIFEKMELYFEAKGQVDTDFVPSNAPEEVQALLSDVSMATIFSAYYKDEKIYAKVPTTGGYYMNLANYLEDADQTNLLNVIKALTFIGNLNVYGMDGNATAALIDTYLPMLDSLLPMFNPSMEEKADETIIKLSVDSSMFLSLQLENAPIINLEISFAKNAYKINSFSLHVAGLKDVNFAELLSNATGFDLTKFVKKANVDNIALTIKPVAYDAEAIPTAETLAGYTQVKLDNLKVYANKINLLKDLFAKVTAPKDLCERTINVSAEYVVGQLTNVITLEGKVANDKAQAKLLADLTLTFASTINEETKNSSLNVIVNVIDKKLVVKLTPTDFEALEKLAGVYVLDYDTNAEKLEEAKTKLVTLLSSLFSQEVEEETIVNTLTGEEETPASQPNVIDLDAILDVFFDLITYEEKEVADSTNKDFVFEITPEKVANILKLFNPAATADGLNGNIKYRVRLTEDDKLVEQELTLDNVYTDSEKQFTLNNVRLFVGYSDTITLEPLTYDEADAKISLKVNDLLDVAIKLEDTLIAAKGHVDEMMPVIMNTVSELTDLQDSFELKLTLKRNELEEGNEHEVVMGLELNVAYDFSENMVLVANGKVNLGTMVYNIKAAIQDGVAYYKVFTLSNDTETPIMKGKVELNAETLGKLKQMLPMILSMFNSGAESTGEAGINFNVLDAITKALDLFRFETVKDGDTVTAYKLVISKERFEALMDVVAKKTTEEEPVTTLTSETSENVVVISFNVVDGAINSVAVDATKLLQYMNPNITELSLTLGFAAEYVQPERLTEDEIKEYLPEETTPEEGEGEPLEGKSEYFDLAGKTVYYMGYSTVPFPEDDSAYKNYIDTKIVFGTDGTFKRYDNTDTEVESGTFTQNEGNGTMTNSDNLAYTIGFDNGQLAIQFDYLNQLKVTIFYIEKK